MFEERVGLIPLFEVGARLFFPSRRGRVNPSDVKKAFLILDF
jgi:hypothetical protein